MTNITAIALLSVMCGGCAIAPDKTAEPPEQKVYQTGSNLPVRDRTAPSNVKLLDPASIEQARSIVGRPQGLTR